MAITTDIDWPDVLPCALREGHSTQHGTPFQRTEMDSGRARNRRRFGSVPSQEQFAWLFTAVQCRAFEAWYRDALGDGVGWFNMSVRSPLGVQPQVCRFVQMYTGPELVGVDGWKVSALLEIWARPLLPPGWGHLPEVITGASILDRAVNKEWPEA